MFGLLLPHLFNFAGNRTFAEHRQLAFVDTPGAIFPRVIDAQDPLNKLTVRQVAGQALAGVFRRVLRALFLGAFGHAVLLK